MIITNKHANRNYFIVESFECGISLKGTKLNQFHAQIVQLMKHMCAN